MPSGDIGGDYLHGSCWERVVGLFVNDTIGACVFSFVFVSSKHGTCVQTHTAYVCVVSIVFT